MKFWPFSEIKRLQKEWGETLATLDQSTKNFNELSDITTQVRSSLNEANLHMASYRRLISATEEQLVVKNAELVNLTVGLAEAKSDLAITQKYVRAADESHMNTVAELEKKTQQFEQALDLLAEIVKGPADLVKTLKFIDQHRSTKNCVKCGSKMIELRGEDKKLCSNGACGHEVDWPLEEGQSYMYKNNVEPFIEDRSNVKEELEPAPSTRERL